MSDAALLSAVLDALVKSTDPATLRAEFDRRLPSQAQGAKAAPAQHGGASEKVLERIVLTDILGDDILGARPGEKAFALRTLFGDMAEVLGSGEPAADAEAAFAFASALNFYFRAALDEEARVSAGLAASKLYYAYMHARGRETREIQATSPLLAALLSSELERVRLESIDQAKTFDGAAHERDAKSSASPAIVTPLSFLCRVAASGVVRSRALVRT